MTTPDLKPHLNRDHGHALLAEMIRIRRFEDKCAELYTQEKIRGFLHLYNGEEAVAVGIFRYSAPKTALLRHTASMAMHLRGASR